MEEEPEKGAEFAFSYGKSQAAVSFTRSQSVDLFPSGFFGVDIPAGCSMVDAYSAWMDSCGTSPKNKSSKLRRPPALSSRTV